MIRNGLGLSGKWMIGMAAVALAGSVASAQQSSWTLFGSSNPESKDVTAEQTFVHPVSSPFFHEDSFNSTDLRLWYVYQDFPNNGVINGGHAQVFGAQIRVALTEQLQLVAYKDGYTILDAGLTSDDGWNDLGAGLKWNFLQDYKDQLFAAVGAGYEFPIGDPSVLQNNGETRVWASVDKGFGKLHLGATVNTFFADDTSRGGLGESNTFSYHLHADYFVCNYFSPVVELNGFHTWDKGNQAVPFSGIDVTTLGGGADCAWIALGGEFRPMDHLGLRAAYELPVTDGTDLFGWRLTLSAVYSF